MASTCFFGFPQACPAILAAEIVEDLQAALDQVAQIAADLANTKTETYPQSKLQDQLQRMMVSPMANRTLTQLNHLRTTNKNAEATYRAAAEDVKNSELETLFLDNAKQHAKFATELRDEIKHLGGDASDSGTFDSALHRGWTDLKSAISGHSAGVILGSCANAEQSAESIYLDAAEAHPTGQVHTLIEKHLQQIKQIRTRLARLEGEIKHGVEFQKNE